MKIVHFKMQTCGLKMQVYGWLTMLKVSKYTIFCQNVLLHKGPHLPTPPKERDKVGSFDWESEMLYGPLIKKDDSREEVHHTTVAQNQNFEANISVERKSLPVPSSISTNKTLGFSINEPPTTSESALLTIPFGNQPLFPLKINTKNDDCLHVAARELISGNDPNCSRTIPSASVTSILQQTMSPESVAILDRWRKQMIAKLGTQGFTKYQEDTFQTGAALHKTIYNFLKGQPTPNSQMDSRILGHWKSIMSVLQEISDVVALEDKLTHPYLYYRGVADCVAKHRNKLVLIEWKTSQKPKPLLRHTYDNPLQVAAYMGAFNANSPEHTQLDSGIIVVCYPDGTPSHTHIMDSLTSQKAWESWLLRLQQFWVFQKLNKKDASNS